VKCDKKVTLVALGPEFFSFRIVKGVAAVITVLRPRTNSDLYKEDEAVST